MRKTYVFVAITVIFATLAGLFFFRTGTARAVSATAMLNDSRATVIVDAGHGGFDGGAVAKDGTAEKDINLNIALQTGELLRLAGYRVIYTRETDTGTENDDRQQTASRKKSDLTNRLQLMRDHPDGVFVSIHLNKFTTTAASGAQMFYAPAFPEAKDLGESIQQSVVKLLQPGNNRVVKKGTKNTFLLYNAAIPAVIVECGFLSNHSDLERLKDEDYQNKMAFAVFCGILDYDKG